MKKNQYAVAETSVHLLVGEPQEGERSHQISACNQYLVMGRGRSLAKVLKHYKDVAAIAKEKGVPIYDVPTENLSTLELWSRRFDWVRRADAYDAAMEAKRNAEAEKVLESGYALVHQRVALLDKLARKTEEMIEKKDMVRRVHKGVGWGEQFQVIEEEEFMEAEIKQLRGMLDDLAQETGGRQKRVNMNHSGLVGMLTNSKAFDDDNVEDAEWEPVESDD